MAGDVGFGLSYLRSVGDEGIAESGETTVSVGI